jgi:hypothetical protein
VTRSRHWSRAGITAVARLAGVSIGTVSNVVNHPERVSEATRTRVDAAIEQLAWAPNPAGVALRSGVLQRRVAVLVPRLTDPDAAALLAGLVDELQRAQVSVLVWHIEDASCIERRLGQATAVGANIVCVVARPDWLRAGTLVTTRLPAVVLAVLETVSSPDVSIDRYLQQGARVGQGIVERLLADDEHSALPHDPTPIPSQRRASEEHCTARATPDRRDDLPDRERDGHSGGALPATRSGSRHHTPRTDGGPVNGVDHV